MINYQQVLMAVVVDWTFTLGGVDMRAQVFFVFF